MRNTWIICRRELSAYFTSPVAYVFIVIFLALAGGLTFFFGNWLERGQADLQVFFLYHPYLYLFLIPAVGMRLWAEERKSGTMEFLMNPANLDRPSGRRQVCCGVDFYRHRVAADVPDLDHREFPRQSR